MAQMSCPWLLMSVSHRADGAHHKAYRLGPPKERSRVSTAQHHENSPFCDAGDCQRTGSGVAARVPHFSSQSTSRNFSVEAFVLSNPIDLAGRPDMLGDLPGHFGGSLGTQRSDDDPGLGKVTPLE